MHAWKFDLRFNVVRILWTLLVKFHGRLWRFATHFVEVFFLCAQWWSEIPNPRLVRIHLRHSEIFKDGTCTGGWFWIYSRYLSLMTTVNHFVNGCPYLNFHYFHTWDCSCEHSRGCTCCMSTLEIALSNIPRDVLVVCPHLRLLFRTFTGMYLLYVHTWDCSFEHSPGCTCCMSTLEIALSNIHRDVLVVCPHLRMLFRTFTGIYSYFWMWRMSINAAKWTFLIFCFCVPSFCDLFSFLFHCRLCIWNQHCLGWKIFCLCFSVSRSMRLRETDLQSLLNHT